MTAQQTQQTDQVHILVADDSPTIHKAVRLTLLDANFTVVTASDGKEALEIVKTRPFDLILADVNMPEMTGYDLSHAIKVRHNMTDIPVVLMCGTFDKFDQDKFIWSKANHRIWKPFETSSFLEVIRQYTERGGVYGKTSEEHTHLCTTSDDASSHLSRGIQERKAVLDSKETATKPPVSSTRQPEKPKFNPPRMSPPPPPKLPVVTIPQSAPPATHTMKPLGTRPPEKAFEVKTNNVGFQVEKAVHEWLKSDAGKTLIRQMVDKELSERLAKIEKELIDQMQKIAWDEEGDTDIKIVQPR